MQEERRQWWERKLKSLWLCKLRTIQTRMKTVRHFHRRSCGKISIMMMFMISKRTSSASIWIRKLKWTRTFIDNNFIKMPITILTTPTKSFTRNKINNAKIQLKTTTISAINSSSSTQFRATYINTINRIQVSPPLSLAITLGRYSTMLKAILVSPKWHKTEPKIGTRCATTISPLCIPNHKLNNWSMNHWEVAGFSVGIMNPTHLLRVSCNHLSNQCSLCILCKITTSNS